MWVSIAQWRTMHNLKENVESIIIGFKSDATHHVYLLETMGENVDKFTCDKCDFKTHSKGNFTIHKSDSHWESTKQMKPPEEILDPCMGETCAVVA